MEKFKISEETLSRLTEIVAQSQETETTIVDEYCNCTGFGG